MLKSLSTLAFSICALLCSAQQKSSGRMEFRKDSLTITGRYDHYSHQPGNEFTVAVPDGVSSYQKNYAAPISANGKFSITIPFPVTGVLYLDWNRITEANVGVPGETIRLYADLDEYKGEDSALDTNEGRREWYSRKTSTRFEGANANLHTQVMLFNRVLRGQVDQGYYDLREKTGSDLVYRDSVVAKMKKELRLLNDYSLKHTLEPRTRQFLEADLYYEAAAALSQYSYKLRELKKDAFSPGYLETLDSIRTIAYPKACLCDGYMTMLRDMRSYASTLASKAKTRNVDSVFALFTKNPLEMELSSAWDANRALESFNPLETADIAAFESKVKNPYLRSAILEKNNALIKLSQDDALLKDTRLITSIPEFTTAEEMLAHITGQFKGKVIYMDIWGTWCSPCREQFKYVPAFKQRLKGKDVVFVYLANHSQETAWKSAIKQHKLIGDNVVHYNLPPAQQSILEKKYLYRGYPTYIIIDKDGKYVTNQAPRPSEPDAAVKVISDLL